MTAKRRDDARDGRKKKPKKEIGSYTQPAKRKNLPTDQTGRTMGSKDAAPVPYNTSSANPSRLPPDLNPPRLCWDRDDADSTPAGPLYIHEKLHPAAFAESLQKTRTKTLDSFFGLYDGIPKGAEFEWYRHSGHWQNRIIRGESRRVMASLLAKEGMKGKVQMIFFDPPYGINFRHVLQANMNKDLDSDQIPNDVAALQTFRDTYERGIHSYLDSIRGIALHSRDLLADKGSFFLQIGSANVNRVGVILDEVFGAENRMGMISFVKTGSLSDSGLSDIADHLLWYAKNSEKANKCGYHQLYESTPTTKDKLDLMSSYSMVELSDGTARTLTPEEKQDPDTLPHNSKLFQRLTLFSQRYNKTRSQGYEWDGRLWRCPQGKQWSVSYEGLDILSKKNRLIGGQSLRWKQYEHEIPGRKRNNVWAKKAAASDKHYVVETAESIIERCMLMTTDPGDLVLDPTCGSGTTAYVAEKWGRRWITSDMGLVAVNLARQRIITGVFPWHMLIDSERGHRKENVLREKVGQSTLRPKKVYGEDPSRGFVCERMRKVSAQYLAYPDREAPVNYMVDRPVEDRARVRVSSPFTVESLSPDRYVDPNPSNSSRSSDVRQNIVSALREVGICMDNSNTTLEDLADYDGRMITHTATFDGKKACILVANDDCTVPSIMVDHAVEEAAEMPSVTVLIVVAFAYEPSVRNERRGRISVYKAMANMDLQAGCLRNNKDDVAFVLVGEPDVKTVIDGDKITVEVVGYDTFDPASGNARPGTKDDVYCWMIDTDYDGRSFFARRVHFPGAGRDNQIKGFYKKLERSIDQDLWASTLSLKSAPFKVPESGRIAVKIITSTHSEMTTVIDVRSGPGKRA